MKKLVLIFICLFVSFEVKSEDESALKRYEKIGNFGLKKEIFKVCESFLKLENLDASTEFIMECEHFVKMYNLKGFSSVDSKNMINNLSQDYDRIKKLVQKEEPTQGLQNFSDDEKLKLLRYWYAKEMYVYMSPIFALTLSKEEIELMAKLETMDCLQHALNLSEKNWSYSDKITELKDLCGNAKWKISDHQNLVDLILNRNFFYPHSKKENYNKISKVLFNFPDAITQCEQSIFDLAPSKRPNHQNARYIKKFYPEENKRANNINWCLQQIVDGTYKIK